MMLNYMLICMGIVFFLMFLITVIGYWETYERIKHKINNLEELQRMYRWRYIWGMASLVHALLMASVMPRSFQEKKLLGFDMKSEAILFDKILGCLSILTLFVLILSTISFIVIMGAERLQIHDFGAGYFDLEAHRNGDRLDTLFDFLRPRFKKPEFWGKIGLFILSIFIYKKIRKKKQIK